MLLHPGSNIIGVETLRVVDGRVIFDDSGDFSTVLVQEMGGPVSDSAESLDDEGLALDSLGEANLFIEGLHAHHLTDGEVNSESG